MKFKDGYESMLEYNGCPTETRIRIYTKDTKRTKTLCIGKKNERWEEGS